MLTSIDLNHYAIRVRDEIYNVLTDGCLTPKPNTLKAMRTKPIPKTLLSFSHVAA
jgi:hypothetical protein